MPVHFFNASQQKAILDSIRLAETNTSGEIRLHIENTCPYELLDRAADVFAMLHMHETDLRNGVLFYLSIEDRKFAILGDAGINSKVTGNFWEGIREEMAKEFKLARFTEGLCKGIEKAGMKLREHFPYQKNDINELPDDISFNQN
ncbi:MAG: TPM domain-containing protein [Cytophagales bacterium]|nr:TPM domain-containing protein [Cytophaga sp.]